MTENHPAMTRAKEHSLAKRVAELEAELAALKGPGPATTPESPPAPYEEARHEDPAEVVQASE